MSADQRRHVHGPCRVQVVAPGGNATGGNSAWQRLGYNSRNADIRTPFGYTDLPSDEYGQGIVPADVQIDGLIAEVTLFMTGWDESVMTQVASPIAGRTEGMFLPADVGTLVVAGSHFGQLYLEASARTGVSGFERPWHFPCSVCIDPGQDVGTRFSTRRIVFRCLRHNPNYVDMCWQRVAPAGVQP